MGVPELITHDPTALTKTIWSCLVSNVAAAWLLELRITRLTAIERWGSPPRSVFRPHLGVQPPTTTTTTPPRRRTAHGALHVRADRRHSSRMC
jgi:hypothetical protein